MGFTPTGEIMKTKNRLQALPRALMHVLLAGLVSFGLFSVASADDGPPKATSVAPAPRAQTSPAADHCTADEPPAPAGLLGLPGLPSDLVVAADASCGAGFTLTRCSCNFGCRPTNISPQNFCKFYLCGP
jgi:hypothetical protein